MKDSDFKPLHADEKGTVVPPIPGAQKGDNRGEGGNVKAEAEIRVTRP